MCIHNLSLYIYTHTNTHTHTHTHTCTTIYLATRSWTLCWQQICCKPNQAPTTFCTAFTAGWTQVVKWSQRLNRLCESAAVSELLACWHRWWPQCPLCRPAALCSHNGQRSRSYCLEVFVTPIAPILVTWTAPVPGRSAAGQLESTDYWRVCKRGRVLAASFSDLLGVLERSSVLAVNCKQ